MTGPKWLLDCQLSLLGFDAPRHNSLPGCYNTPYKSMPITTRVNIKQFNCSCSNQISRYPVRLKANGTGTAVTAVLGVRTSDALHHFVCTNDELLPICGPHRPVTAAAQLDSISIYAESILTIHAHVTIAHSPSASPRPGHNMTSLWRCHLQSTICLLGRRRESWREAGRSNRG